MSTVSNAVTPAMIKELYIPSHCNKMSIPCGHTCIIILTDGRRREIYLDGYFISDLKAKLPEESIVNGWDDHLDKYGQGISIRWTKRTYSNESIINKLTRTFQRSLSLSE